MRRTVLHRGMPQDRAADSPCTQKPMTNKPLKLTKDEISFLRLLEGGGGQSTLSGNLRFGLYDRLVKAGYILMQADGFSMDTVHFKLTKLGSDALLASSRINGRPA